MNAKVAIVYHSGYGHTAQLAEAVKRGVEAGGVEVVYLTAEEAQKNMAPLDTVDGIIFGCPTYMGGPSAQFKAFADATGSRWMKQSWKDKLAGGFTNSGSLSGDKLATLMQLTILAAQHSMIWVGTGVPGPGTSSGYGGKPEDVNRVGSFLGVMAQSYHAAPELAPSPGDKMTGELFGQRFAAAVKQWVAGRK